MSLTEVMINIVSWIIREMSWIGVFIAMVLESACLPIPSEIVMPLAGFVLCQDITSVIFMSLNGALANLIGSWIAYTIGRYYGEAFVTKLMANYGKYLLIGKHEYGRAKEFFVKYGTQAVFFGRMLPVIRTFISLPAGIFSIDPLKFTLYTIIGSIPWNLALTYAGYILGENWYLIEKYLYYLDIAIITVLSASFIYLLLRPKLQAILSKSRSY